MASILTLANFSRCAGRLAPQSMSSLRPPRTSSSSLHGPLRIGYVGYSYRLQRARSIATQAPSRWPPSSHSQTSHVARGASLRNPCPHFALLVPRRARFMAHSASAMSGTAIACSGPVPSPRRHLAGGLHPHTRKLLTLRGAPRSAIHVLTSPSSYLVELASWPTPHRLYRVENKQTIRRWPAAGD